jgi:hypothetical protein
MRQPERGLPVRVSPGDPELPPELHVRGRRGGPRAVPLPPAGPVPELHLRPRRDEVREAALQLLPPREPPEPLLSAVRRAARLQAPGAARRGPDARGAVVVPVPDLRVSLRRGRLLGDEVSAAALRQPGPGDRRLLSPLRRPLSHGQRLGLGPTLHLRRQDVRVGGAIRRPERPLRRLQLQGECATVAARCVVLKLTDCRGLNVSYLTTSRYCDFHNCLAR